MPYLLDTTPVRQLDDNGNPVPGAKLYTFVAGTTTPQGVFATQTGNVLLPNPIVADANGFWPALWLSGGAYKLEARKADGVTVLWQRDGVSAPAPASRVQPTFQTEPTRVATAGQKVFDLAAVTYTPGTGALWVFVNGIRLPSAEFTETTSTRVTLGIALDDGDEVDFIAGAPVNNSLAIDSSLISYVTGGAQRSVQAKLADCANFLDFEPAIDRTGVTSASALLQSALNKAVAAGVRRLVLNPGTYRMTAPLNVTSRIELDFSDREAVLMLATQNMNGIVIGDGTSATRSATFLTKIIGPSFTAAPGVAQFTSGACIFENFVAYVDVVKPSFYGLDAGARKLWTAIRQYKCQECDTVGMLSQEMHGPVIYADGAAGLADSTVDCNYDFIRIIGCDTDAVYWGANCGGMGMYRPTIYGTNGRLIAIVGSGAGTDVEVNYFITDVDGEIDGAGQGIYAQGVQRVMLNGGWIGGGVNAGVLPLGVWFGTTCGSSVIDVSISGARVLIDGPSTRIAGGDYAGDITTAGVGITVTGTAADCTIADGVQVRQWPGTGIALTGTPARATIGGISFRANGTDITGLAGYAALLNRPVLGRGNTDKARSLTAAAALAVSPSLSFVQVTGGTAITSIPVQGIGSRLTIQANTGGITLAAGGNLQLKSPPVAVPAFATISLVCDGTNWFDDGRNF